jgi:hypothetical protein
VPGLLSHGCRIGALVIALPLGLPALGFGLGLGITRAAERPATVGRADQVDAELLRDLDVLASPDYPRDRDVAPRVPVLELLRLLEMLRLLEGQPARVAPAPVQRERAR